MSHDLIFGKTKRNIARDQSSQVIESQARISDEVTFAFSEDERTMLEKASTLRMKADSGDKAAKKELVQFTKNVAKLKARAKKGDAKAKRALLVLSESGIFNPTQKLDITGGWASDPHAQDRRFDRFKEEVSKMSPSQIDDTSKMVAFNPEYKKHTLALIAQGNPTARKILDASEKYAAGVATKVNVPVIAMRGSSPARKESQVEQARLLLRQLQQKSPKTEDDCRTIEQLTERLTRLEAMSGIGTASKSRR
jgi:hypothetical protein